MIIKYLLKYNYSIQFIINDTYFINERYTSTEIRAKLLNFSYHPQ